MASATATKVEAPASEPTKFILPKMSIKTVVLTLEGLSPLIVNRFSEKALRQMADKQGGKAREKKAPKVPEQDFWGSLYHLEPNQTYPHKKGYRYGFPAIGFKASAVTACTSIDGITKVAARQAFHINADLIEIKGTPKMRCDTVKIAMGTTDLRYRAEFEKWSAEVPVEFNANLITAEQLVHLFNTAGFSVGIGEWRPERDGAMGRFKCV